MVDMSKEEGGQEVDVMSKEKEKGGEEHEELSIMKELGREASKKDVGQDMDTIMQTLDALVENIVPPTATTKMPPAGEKKRKVEKAISPSSLTRRVKEGRRTRSQSALFKADIDLIRGKLAWDIIEEVNREKAHKSSGEEAAEKIVSLLDEA
ncbi:hypothetical protein Taro_026650 [Colocasia esculenta]|uniref:Uncharacterized protein n=1 Tax=Colocasia esculenta TaxID=4460 RepID=A0A843V6P9_COLES|nr:hypothetical protein [Colocasia esculenta]